MWTYNHSAFIVKARKVTAKPVEEEKPETVSEEAVEPAEETVEAVEELTED